MTAASLEAPSYEVVGNFVPLSPEWHAARANGLGGSEIAAVVGLSPWESHFSLWHRKAGRLADQPDSGVMEWGRRLEPALLAKFLAEHDEFDLFDDHCTYRSAERPWQIANPDGFLVSALPVASPTFAIWEGKTAQSDDEWGTPGTDEIPPYYLLQTRWYLDVLDLDTCYVSVLIRGCDYREYVVHPDAADTQLMRTAGAAFMESIAADRRPNIDDHAATYAAVREMHPDIDGSEVEIPPRLARWYQAAVAACASAERRKRKHAATIADRMGSARRATCDGQPIAIRVPGRGANPPFLRPSATKETS
ncbi:MAG: phage-related protein predicted endonuclease-like protein [Frankiales bacterium]|nr:phage-related protein predicted endonuclease-like protein [Frankiales bacterium]